MAEHKPTTPEPLLDTYALVEIMGHQRIVGKITEAVIAGGPFLRVDVPAFNGSPAFTRFYGAQSIYCISPVSEEIARGLMASHRNEPVSRFELPQLAEKASEPEGQGEDDNPDYCPDCKNLVNECTCELR